MIFVFIVVGPHISSTNNSLPAANPCIKLSNSLTLLVVLSSMDLIKGFEVSRILTRGRKSAAHITAMTFIGLEMTYFEQTFEGHALALTAAVKMLSGW